MKPNNGLAVLLIVALAMGIGVLGWWSYTAHRSQPTTPSQSTPQQQANPVTPPPASGTQPSNQPAKTYLVKVYFSKHTESDNDPSAVFPVNRTTNSLGVATFAISQLLQGPTTAEQASGYFTTARLRNDASNCNNHDFTIAIANGTATLRFCRTFDHLGVVADGQAKSELDATLKQFSSVQKVVILNKSGNCEFDLSGANLCLQ